MGQKASIKVQLDRLSPGSCGKCLVRSCDESTVQSVKSSHEVTKTFTDAPARVASSSLMFSGLSKCARCGSALTGHVAMSGQNHYYSCSDRNKRGIDTCSKSMVRRYIFESAVLRRVQDVRLSPQNMEKIVKEVNQQIHSERASSKEHITRIEKERLDLDARLGRYYEAFESGSLSPSDLQDRITQLKNKIAYPGC